MCVDEGESEKYAETGQAGVFFVERAQEEKENERNKEIPDDVSDDAAGDEFGLRRSEGIQRSAQEEKGECDELRPNQFPERGCVDDPVGENDEHEEAENVDEEEKNDRSGRKEIRIREKGECSEGEMLSDDEIGDRFRFGKPDTLRLIDDFVFLVDGQTMSLGDGFGPVEMVTEIGRGRNNRV